MTRPTLEYQSAATRPRGRAVPAVAIAATLAVINGLWATLLLVLQHPSVNAELNGTLSPLLATGLLPSATMGSLIAAVAARGRWRVPTLIGNLLALGVVLGLIHRWFIATPF